MSALERLEQYAREGQHAERLALATRTLELHPSSADALHHRVLALLELRGFEGALAALHEASEPLLARGETLPPALLETYRALAQRAAMVQRTPKAGGEILEVSPAPTLGLYRVRFASGCVAQMSATILERHFGVWVDANVNPVH